MMTKKTKFAGVLTTLTISSAMLGAAAVANTNQALNVTAQDLNQNTGAFVGKQVALTGKIDRVLGNGAYIVSDRTDEKNPSHRVLVFTSNATNASGSKQKAGIAAVSLKEGDGVKLDGKLEQFNISSEVDSFSPKSDTETIDESKASMPVVVIQNGGIWRNQTANSG